MGVMIYVGMSSFKIADAPASAPVPPLKVTSMPDTVAWTPFELPAPFALVSDETALPDDTDAMGRLAEEIAQYASQFIGRRYRLGANGPRQFDCSSLMRYIFANSGVELPRTSRMQYRQGEKVDRSDLRPGDLMFFSSPSSGRGRVGHVAMVVDVEPDGDVTFIHASTSKGVTYQRFPDGGYFSRNYIGARRVLTA